MSASATTKVGVVPGVVRSTIAMIREPLEFMTRISAAHGDIVKFRLLNNEVYLFNHPEAIEELVIARKDLLVKDWLTRELGLVVGKGLLLSEGALWKKQRRLIQPGFHRERIAQYANEMVAFTTRATRDWHTGEVRDLHKDLMRLTLDIVAKTLFGVDAGPRSRRVEAALEVMAHRFAGADAVIPIGLPLPSNFRTRRAIADLDDVTYGIIKERRASGDTGDLISMLIASSEGEGGMSDRQLRDEAITLLLAGHETTAVALGWALYLLAKHPEAQRRVRDEVAQVVGARPATADDVPKLRYAEGVVKEAMRLYPPAWAIGREATEPLSVAGVQVKRGDQLWAAQWVVHRDPRWFPEPESFRPERWETATPPKHAYFPFGGGPRVCIGNAFAMMEMVLVLVTMLRELEVAAVHDVGIAPSVTLRPKGGMPLRITCRSHAS